MDTTAEGVGEDGESPPVGRGRRPRSAFRVLRKLAPWVLGVLLVAYVGVSYIAADLLTRPNNHPSVLDARRQVSASATDWSTTTDDGLTIRGWYCPSKTNRQLLVLVHGMGGSWEQMAGIARGLHRKGYSILLFDLRGHGQSDPARLSMGRRERKDLQAVLAWATEEGFSPDRIGWLGHSLGASTLLMEAATNPNILVAVVDSPFSDLPALLKSQLPKHSHLPPVFNPGILFVAHRVFGVRTDDLRPIRMAGAWGARPLLLIHGDADTVVPVAQAEDLAAAIGPACEVIILHGVEHVSAFQANPAAYVARIDRFFREHLSK